MSLSWWIQRAGEELRGRDPSTLDRHLPYGTLKALYTQEDLPPSPIPMPGMPGSPRGVRATMYANRPWTTRQYAGFGTAAETNAMFRERYERGDLGMSVAFDLPTHLGRDSLDLRVSNEVGLSGVALDSANDFTRLFEGVPLNEVSVSMTMNGAVLQALSGLVVAGYRQGIKPNQIRGTIQNDPLKEFAVRNTEIFGMDASMRIATDIIEYCSREMPLFNPISISGYHYQEAGADLHQELAFMLAGGIEYMRAMKGKGMDVDDFAPRLSFFYSIGIDFWGEVAKMRAGRILWDRYATEMGAVDEKSRLLRFHSHTSGVSLQQQDPYFNIVRATLESLAAVLGGTQSLHTSSFDEAVALPSDEATRVSNATQRIIRDEAEISRVIDPLGGSYFVEAATQLMADAADVLVREIEAMGGMRVAVESGWVEEQVTAAAAKRQAAIDSGDAKIVGVNTFTSDSEPLDAKKIDSSKVLDAQRDSIEALKANRDNTIVVDRLRELQQAARTDVNLVPPTIEAMGHGATWGEITSTLELALSRRERIAITANGVYGKAMADNPEFAAVKTRVATATEAGHTPKVLLVKFGLDGHDRGANIVATGFRDAGFEVRYDGVISSTPDGAARQALEGEYDVIGISSHSGAHIDQVGQLVAELRAFDPDARPTIVVGGIIPADDHEALKNLGVDVIFGPGTRIADAANQVLDAIGVPKIVDSPAAPGHDAIAR